MHGDDSSDRGVGNYWESLMRDAFNQDGEFQLSESEVDQLLERFDQTAPQLQRHIIVVFICRAQQGKELLCEVDRLVGNASNDFRRHLLTPELRDRISNFIS